MSGELYPRPRRRYTEQEWRELVVNYGWRCYWCGKSVCENSPNPALELTKDHVIPICRGGVEKIENLVPACNACNALKGKRTGEEFLAYRPAFSTRLHSLGGISTGDVSLEEQTGFENTLTLCIKKLAEVKSMANVTSPVKQPPRSADMTPRQIDLARRMESESENPSFAWRHPA